MSHAEAGQRDFLDLLIDRSCFDCEDGTLERDTYKGNEAVVCDECGTPRAQSW